MINICDTTVDKKVINNFEFHLGYDHFESGYYTIADRILQDEYDKDKQNTINMIFNLYYELLLKNETYKIANLFRTISNIEYNKLYSIIALSAISLDNKEIYDVVISAFENWDNIDSYHMLLKIKDIGCKWIDDYKYMVIEDLKRHIKNEDKI